ncbi:MAG: PorP/SprF family type IX secretion system membrane protein [Sphingobacteriaceae bacterium]|nr:PorP/SprF family type IX secretion system membrane protein [Sphingobacteriaceae bacterium]
MKKILTIIFLSFLIGSNLIGQQQTLLTNFVLHRYMYNPAFAGTNTGMEFNANYRNQWTGFTGAPKTIAVSGYGTFKKKPNMAVGGMVYSDKTGLVQRTNFYGSYSYHVKLNKKYSLGFGLALGGVQYNVKVYDAIPFDKDDEFLKNDILNANAFDANSGLYFYSKKFFFGLSSAQMVNGKIHWFEKEGRLSPHFYVMTGFNQILDKKKKEWMLQPTFLARFNNPSPYMMELGLRGLYKEMYWLGFSGRVWKNFDKKWKSASACVLVGATISKQFTLAYSYDYALTALNQYSSGSHEIILTYTKLGKKRKTASEKVMDADESEFNNIDNSMKSNLKNKKKEEEPKND